MWLPRNKARSKRITVITVTPQQTLPGESNPGGLHGSTMIDLLLLVLLQRLRSKNS